MEQVAFLKVKPFADSARSTEWEIAQGVAMCVLFRYMRS